MIPTISTVAIIGTNQFRSIYSDKSLRAFSQGSGVSPRAYAATTNRGVLIGKEFVENIRNLDFSKKYSFQFNPQVVTDAKETLYETRNYAGIAYSDYIWGGGGERNISFQLFLDNTPQSKISTFSPSVEAATIKTEGAALTNKQQQDSDILGALGAQRYMPAPNIKEFEYNMGNAYSLTRVDARGVLPEVEQIRSFLYPAPLKGENTPKFAEGGIVSMNQFRPPAIAVLSLGPLYLEGVIKSAPVTYTLFDQDLTPIRATIDIVFSVYEFEELHKL